MPKKLKVYFACSIHGEKGGQAEKDLIVKTINNLGHRVLTEIFPTDGIHARGAKLGPFAIYKEDMDWIKESDVLVADVTRISLGVGYEVGWSVAKKKKVVALYNKKKKGVLSFMLQGNKEESFHLHYWKSEKELRTILRKELGNAAR